MDSPEASTSDSDAARAELVVTRLLRVYRPGAGRLRPATGAAWQLALAIEAVATTYERTRDPALLDALHRWAARHASRRSHFFDDDGWYVNAWLRAYEVSGDTGFLSVARAGFADLLPAWDEVCGGGLWWSRERSYKNAITNELFLLAAARLHRWCPRAGYGDWATRAWVWFDGSGMINSDGLVNDGLRHDCANNGGTTWTYNQGVILGALAEFWRATGEPEPLSRAHRVASSATTLLVDADGILREPCETTGSCDRDQEIFKGVFAQGLARLHRADPRPPYAAFLRANADSLWRRGRDRRGQLGLRWAGPPDHVTPATHAAGSLLLAEVALLG